MSGPKSPTPIKFVPAAIILGSIGWTGLIWLFFNTFPTVGPRWFFFLFWFLAITGPALPLVAFLNRRFPPSFPAKQKAILRQSMWIGFYGATLAWLQIGRIITPALALLIAFGLAAIEWLIRLRERSMWRP